MLALIEETAHKMKIPAEVRRIALHPPADLGRRTLWNDLSLATGYPGLLLLFAHLERVGLFDGTAHQYVLAIHQEIQRQPINDLSLFGGVSGVCFALREASHGGTRYQGMIHTLDKLLLEKVGDVYLQPLRAYRKRQEAAPSGLHDLIQGLPGVGRYMLEDLPLFGGLLEQSVKVLVEFSKPILYKGQTVPGWILSASDLLNIRSTPRDNFNVGLAHGIPGILAFLSIAWLKGIQVEGQKEAMIQIVDWIQQKSIVTENVIRWPAVSSLDGARCTPTRDAWCYGVPGVARSLYLCGTALGDQALLKFACMAFRQIFQRLRGEWNLPGPMICHGISGLLLLSEAMGEQTEMLNEFLLNCYNPDLPFGFRDVHLNEKGEFVEVDSPGLLEGSAGVLLTLFNPKSSWHLPFLVDQ